MENRPMMIMIKTKHDMAILLHILYVIRNIKDNDKDGGGGEQPVE
jgi:hypothetical protein